jgi:opacity protein-like surface antigen
MAAVALAIAFAPRWAAAQTSDIEGTPPQPSEQKPHGIGFSLSAAGGFSVFSRSSARDFLDTGATWDVRGVFGTRTLVGFEAAYLGAAYGFDAPGGITRTLYGHGLEGSLRINIMRNGLVYGRGAAVGLQPYVLGGFGWIHYHLSNNVSTASIDNSDNTLQLPVGAGLSYYLNSRVLLDARFAYRFAFSDNLIQGSSLDNYSVTARLGAEF